MCHNVALSDMHVFTTGIIDLTDCVLICRVGILFVSKMFYHVVIIQFAEVHVKQVGIMWQKDIA